MKINRSPTPLQHLLANCLLLTGLLLPAIAISTEPDNLSGQLVDPESGSRIQPDSLYHAVLVSSELREIASDQPSSDQPLSVQPLVASHQSLASNHWQVSLSAIGRDYNLVLSNSPVTGNTKFIGSFDEDEDLRLFQGTVEGDEQSWVRLTLHDGLLTGHLFAFGELLQILRSDTPLLQPDTVRMPDTEQPAKRQLFQTPTVMLKNPELAALEAIHEALPAGAAHAELDYLLFAPKESADNHDEPDSVDSLLYQDNTQRVGALPVTRAIRIGIVVDSLFDEYHNNRGVAEALTIINAVDGIYQQQLGLAIVVDTVRANVNPATDPMRDQGGTIEQILDNFRVTRVFDNQLPADLTLVHLFTGLRDPDGVIGLGWINTACRTDGYDVSVSTPFAFHTLLAAHEMAHNLGALHDDNPRCDTARTSIMWPRLSGSTGSSFSNCSKNAIAPNINASCNLDNIDLAVGLQASNVGQNLVDQRRVTMKLRNNDPNRRIDNVSIVARFPPGSLVADAPSYCNSTGLQLRCNLAGLDAGVTDSITARVILGNTSSPQWAQLSVLVDNFADTIDANNSVAMDILQIGSTGATNATSAASDQATDSSLNDQGQAQVFVGSAAGGSSGDAIGSTAPELLALLALLSAARHGLARRRLATI